MRRAATLERGAEKGAGRGGGRTPARASKEEWGPRGWNWLHVTAISYAHDPTPAEAGRAYRRIRSFVGSLPCPECSGHASAYVARNPPDLADTFALQAWVWRFHNAVNLRLGKRAVTYEEYRALYADEILWAGG